MSYASVPSEPPKPWRSRLAESAVHVVPGDSPWGLDSESQVFYSICGERMEERTTLGGAAAPGLCPVCGLEPTTRGSSCCATCQSSNHEKPRCPRCHNVVSSSKVAKCGVCTQERPSKGWPQPPFAFEAGYMVLAEIDRDVSGVIYLAARDFDTNESSPTEHVALKVGTDDAAKDELYEAYRAESFKLGRFGNQPDILQVMGVERTRYKAPYFVTELAGGPTLSRVLLRVGAAIELGSAAWIGWKLAEALQKVHEQRLVHLGLRPSNLFILDWGSSREAIKLAGFGGSIEVHSQGSVSVSVAVPATSETLIDPRFASPEQAVILKGTGKATVSSPELDHRADIYSLGLILYLMLTKALPFAKVPRSDAGWLKAHRFTAPLDPCERRKELPPYLCEVVLRCLRKDPDARFQSAQEVGEALKDVLLNEVLPESRQRAAMVTVPATVEPERKARSEATSARLRVRTRAAEQRIDELEDEVLHLQDELDEAKIRLKRAVSARQRAEARAAAEQAKVDHPSAPVVLRLSQKLLSRVTSKFVRLLPGTFTMGSPLAEAGRLERVLDVSSDPYNTELSSINFELQHEVTLSRPFLLQSTPVTQAQFEAVMGFNPSDFKDPRFPVESVSWYDAVTFCNRLSEQQGIPKEEWAYSIHERNGEAGEYGFEAVVEWLGPERLGFRLSTEAEWEYACRAATMTATYNGDLDPVHLKDEQPNSMLDPIAWFSGNSDSQTHKVATKGPNEWGLSDMLGNVWEWVWDWDDMYPSDPVSDPNGPASGENRVIRGGSWSLYARFCRAAYRGRDWPGHRFNDIGFRPARTLP